MAAAIGLLQRGYLNIKRSLVLAVRELPRGFPLPVAPAQADVQIDVSMDLVALKQAANDSITGLNQVLAGTPPGPSPASPGLPECPLPRHPHSCSRRSTVSPKPSSRSIPRSSRANSTAIPHCSWRAATLELESGTQSEGEVRAADRDLRPLHQPAWQEHASVRTSRRVSMTNDYYPGTPPTWVTEWAVDRPGALPRTDPVYQLDADGESRTDAGGHRDQPNTVGAMVPESPRPIRSTGEARGFDHS